MAEHRYKAYLSYSHSDESWARWVHRSLESYRVPASLRGQRPDGREVPDRLSPIFRDREDLSSAADLSEGLTQAMRDSESLILICSPAAAASRWVNEEVRYFQSLGRADRVFCMVVDGEPDSSAGEDSCFPPALFDGVDDAPAEPLAADPRPYADGKSLARLKLIAGMLGVRLDDLRRRDLKRKRRWQALSVVAVVGVITLMALAISSRIAEQRERQSAEQMATFIVDLGEDLKTEIDLEALGLISSKAMTYLEQLDPRQLSPDTALKVGLALRQLAQVSEGQGRSEDARQAYFQSRALFEELTELNPDRQDLLFELGQAEFYVAAFFFYSGEDEQAMPYAQRYADVSRQLYESDPDNLQWQFERSYAATGLLAMKVDGPGPHRGDLLTEADQALTLAWQILQEHPDNPEAISNYSSSLAWAADARLMACELNQAWQERQQTLVMAEKALSKQPSDNSSRESYAYAHSGVASVDSYLGDLDSARDHWETAIDVLNGLWKEDPSNERLRVELQWRRLNLTEALLEMNEVLLVSELLASVRQDMPEIEDASRDFFEPGLQLGYLTSKARLAEFSGDPQVVRKSLSDALRAHQPVGPAEEWSPADRQAMALAYFTWWRNFGALPEGTPRVPLIQPEGLRHCRDAVTNLRLALVQDNRQEALQELDYLKSKGFLGNGVQHMCRDFGLCQP